LFYITTWRLGGVGALEGSKKVLDRIFSQNKETSVFLAEDNGNNHIFPQNIQDL
jgi:hypothetical protein